ncbi:hypothetical protein L1049_005673 [Liquidambar formosana]|uniref:Coilin n=1 Tax=Liquidambar formosana TaxID=63359 RepID=A0AAP0WPX5_LIQFO
MEPVRLRLEFDDRHILSKSQRTEGLKRIWLLLKPQLSTISDFTSYLTHILDLDDACPNGILLSMDGFVLPPFESTCMLKDKDLIRVKKKGKSSDIIKVRDRTNSLEIEEIVEKQPVVTGVKLLANEEFDKEIGGYQSEPEDDEEDQSEDTLPVENTLGENAVSKKRKASRKLQSSKRKKNKYTTPEICPGSPEDVKNDVHAEQVEGCYHSGVLPKKNLLKKKKSSDVKGKPDKVSAPKIDERNDNIGESLRSATEKGFHQLQENGKGSVDVSHTNDGTKKFPSRSARRKKAKRQWMRELAKVEKGELNQRQSPEKDEQKSPENDDHQSPKNDHQQLPKKDVHIISANHRQQNQNSDVEDEVVPIVIRPGHIRFEPLGKDEVVQQNQVPVETSHWNGITSKKRGQKWGKEKATFCKRNDYTNFSQEYFGVPTIEERVPVNDSMDFDKLAPFTSLPKKGDVIAYRLIELSSSWTPELSSFRVGKISRYYPESNKIILVPVPEHPIAFEKNIDEEASALQSATSLYREDGSLEVDFKSLVDIRIVKHGNLEVANTITGGVNAANAVIGRVNGTPVGDQSAVSDFRPNNNNKEKHAQTPENGKVDVWDEISKALNAKKEQLSQENSWHKKESSGRSPWSYKALRSSALGPTMALLRAQKGL